MEPFDLTLNQVNFEEKDLSPTQTLHSFSNLVYYDSDFKDDDNEHGKGMPVTTKQFSDKNVTKNAASFLKEQQEFLAEKQGQYSNAYHTISVVQANKRMDKSTAIEPSKDSFKAFTDTVEALALQKSVIGGSKIKPASAEEIAKAIAEAQAKIAGGQMKMAIGTDLSSGPMAEVDAEDSTDHVNVHPQTDHEMMEVSEMKQDGVIALSAQDDSEDIISAGLAASPFTAASIEMRTKSQILTAVKSSITVSQTEVGDAGVRRDVKQTAEYGALQATKDMQQIGIHKKKGMGRKGPSVTASKSNSSKKVSLVRIKPQEVVTVTERNSASRVVPSEKIKPANFPTNALSLIMPMEAGNEEGMIAEGEGYREMWLGYEGMGRSDTVKGKVVHPGDALQVDVINLKSLGKGHSEANERQSDITTITEEHSEKSAAEYAEHVPEIAALAEKIGKLENQNSSVSNSQRIVQISTTKSAVAATDGTDGKVHVSELNGEGRFTGPVQYSSRTRVENVYSTETQNTVNVKVHRTIQEELRDEDVYNFMGSIDQASESSSEPEDIPEERPQKAAREPSRRVTKSHRYTVDKPDLTVPALKKADFKLPDIDPSSLKLQFTEYSAPKQIANQKSDNMVSDATYESLREELTRVLKENAKLEGQLEMLGLEARIAIKERAELQAQVAGMKSQLQAQTRSASMAVSDRETLENEIQTLRQNHGHLEKVIINAQRVIESKDVDYKALQDELQLVKDQKDDSQDKVVSLKKELAMQESKVVDFKNKITELYVEYQMSNQARILADNEMKSLQSEIKSLQSSQNWYQEQLKQLQDGKAEMQEKISAFQTKHIENMTLIERLKAENVRVKQQLTDAQQKALNEKNILAHHLEVIEADMIEREAAFAQLQQQRLSLEQLVNNEDLKAKQIEEMVNVMELQEEISKLKNENRRRQAQVSVLEHEQTELVKRLTLSQESILERDKTIDDIDKKFVELQLHCQTLENDLSNKNTEVSRLTNLNSTLEDDLKAAKEEKVKFDESLSTLKEDMIKVEHNFKKMKNELAQKEVELSQALGEKKTTEQTVESLRSEMAMLSARQQQQVAQLQSELERQQAESEKLQQSAVPQQEELSLKCQQLEDEKIALTSNLNAALEENRNLQQQWQDMQTKLLQANSETSSVSDKCDLFEKQLLQSQQENAQLQCQLKELESASEELTKLREEHGKHHVELSRAVEENQAYKRKSEDLEKYVQHQQETQKQLEEKVNAYMIHVKELEVHRSNAESGLKAAMESLQQRSDANDKETSKYVKSLETEVSNLKTQCSEWQTQLKESAGKLEEYDLLKLKVKSLEEHVQNAGAPETKTEETLVKQGESSKEFVSLDAHIDEVNALRLEIQSLNDQLEELEPMKEKLKFLEGEEFTSDAVTNELEEARVRIQDMQMEIDEWKKVVEVMQNPGVGDEDGEKDNVKTEVELALQQMKKLHDMEMDELQQKLMEKEEMLEKFQRARGQMLSYPGDEEEDAEVTDAEALEGKKLSLDNLVKLIHNQSLTLEQMTYLTTSLGFSPSQLQRSAEPLKQEAKMLKEINSGGDVSSEKVVEVLQNLKLTREQLLMFLKSQKLTQEELLKLFHFDQMDQEQVNKIILQLFSQDQLWNCFLSLDLPAEQILSLAQAKELNEEHVMQLVLSVKLSEEHLVRLVQAQALPQEKLVTLVQSFNLQVENLLPVIQAQGLSEEQLVSLLHSQNVSKEVLSNLAQSKGLTVEQPKTHVQKKDGSAKQMATPEVEQEPQEQHKSQTLTWEQTLSSIQSQNVSQDQLLQLLSTLNISKEVLFTFMQTRISEEFLVAVLQSKGLSQEQLMLLVRQFGLSQENFVTLLQSQTESLPNLVALLQSQNLSPEQLGFLIQQTGIMEDHLIELVKSWNLSSQKLISLVQSKGLTVEQQKTLVQTEDGSTEQMATVEAEKEAQEQHKDQKLTWEQTLLSVQEQNVSQDQLLQLLSTLNISKEVLFTFMQTRISEEFLVAVLQSKGLSQEQLMLLVRQYGLSQENFVTLLQLQTESLPNLVALLQSQNLSPEQLGFLIQQTGITEDHLIELVRSCNLSSEKLISLAQTKEVSLELLLSLMQSQNLSQDQLAGLLHSMNLPEDIAFSLVQSKGLSQEQLKWLVQLEMSQGQGLDVLKSLELSEEQLLVLIQSQKLSDEQKLALAQSMDLSHEGVCALMQSKRLSPEQIVSVIHQQISPEQVTAVLSSMSLSIEQILPVMQTMPDEQRLGLVRSLNLSAESLSALHPQSQPHQQVDGIVQKQTLSQEQAVLVNSAQAVIEEPAMVHSPNVVKEQVKKLIKSKNMPVEDRVDALTQGLTEDQVIHVVKELKLSQEHLLNLVNVYELPPEKVYTMVHSWLPQEKLTEVVRTVKLPPDVVLHLVKDQVPQEQLLKIVQSQGISESQLVELIESQGFTKERILQLLRIEVPAESAEVPEPSREQCLETLSIRDISESHIVELIESQQLSKERILNLLKLDVPAESAGVSQSSQEQYMKLLQDNKLSAEQILTLIHSNEVARDLLAILIPSQRLSKEDLEQFALYESSGQALKTQPKGNVPIESHDAGQQSEESIIEMIESHQLSMEILIKVIQRLPKTQRDSLSPEVWRILEKTKLDENQLISILRAQTLSQEQITRIMKSLEVTVAQASGQEVAQPHGQLEGQLTIQSEGLSDEKLAEFLEVYKLSQDQLMTIIRSQLSQDRMMHMLDNLSQEESQKIADAETRLRVEAGGSDEGGNISKTVTTETSKHLTFALNTLQELETELKTLENVDMSQPLSDHWNKISNWITLTIKCFIEVKNVYKYYIQEKQQPSDTDRSEVERLLMQYQEENNKLKQQMINMSDFQTPQVHTVIVRSKEAGEVSEADLVAEVTELRKQLKERSVENEKLRHFQFNISKAVGLEIIGQGSSDIDVAHTTALTQIHRYIDQLQQQSAQEEEQISVLMTSMKNMQEDSQEKAVVEAQIQELQHMANLTQAARIKLEAAITSVQDTCGLTKVTKQSVTQRSENTAEMSEYVRESGNEPLLSSHQSTPEESLTFSSESETDSEKEIRCLRDHLRESKFRNTQLESQIKHIRNYITSYFSHGVAVASASDSKNISSSLPGKEQSESGTQTEASGGASVMAGPSFTMEEAAVQESGTVDGSFKYYDKGSNSFDKGITQFIHSLDIKNEIKQFIQKELSVIIYENHQVKKSVYDEKINEILQKLLASNEEISKLKKLLKLKEKSEQNSGQLQEHIKELEDEMADLTEQKSQLEVILQEANKSIREMNEQLSSAQQTHNAHVEKTTEVINQWQEACNARDQQLQLFHTQIIELQKEIETRKAESEQQKSEMTETKNLALELEKEKGRLAGVMQSYNALKDHAATLESALAQQESSVTDLSSSSREELEKRNKLITQLEEKISELEEAVQSEKNANKDVKKQLMTEKGAHIKAKRLAESIQQDQKQEKADLELAREELAKTVMLLEETREKERSLTISLEDARSKIQALQTELERLKRELSDKQGKDPIMQERIKTLEWELSQKAAELDATQNRVHLIEDRNQMELVNIQKALQMSNNDVKILRDEVAAVKQEKVVLQAKVAELRANLEVSNVQNKVFQFQKKEIATKEEITNVGATVSTESKGEGSAIKIESKPLSFLQETLNSLRGEISNLQLQVDEHTCAVQSSSQAWKDLEVQVKDLRALCKTSAADRTDKTTVKKREPPPMVHLPMLSPPE